MKDVIAYIDLALCVCYLFTLLAAHPSTMFFKWGQRKFKDNFLSVIVLSFGIPVISLFVIFLIL